MVINLTASKIVLDQDAKCLLNVADSLDGINGKKQQLMIHLLFKTGIRVSELAGIRVKDTPYYIGVRLIEVYKGKRGNCRNIPVTQETALMIEDYILNYRPKTVPRRVGKMNPNGWLFYDRNGHKYSRQAIAGIISRLSFAAGMRKKITPHMCRHRFATVALSQGIDIWKVKSWLGHASLATTEKYINMTYLFDVHGNDDLSQLDKALTAVLN